MWGPLDSEGGEHNFTNYGFPIPITIVFMWFINQQTSLGGGPPYISPHCGQGSQLRPCTLQIFLSFFSAACIKVVAPFVP